MFSRSTKKAVVVRAVCEVLPLEPRQLFVAITPETYGAVVNDGNDDRAAINAALAALQPGDTLQFAAGTYELSSTISRDTLNNVTIKGSISGTTTIKKRTSGWSGEYLFYTRYGTNATVYGIRFEGLTTNTSSPTWGEQGLYFGSTTGTNVNYCSFYNFGDAAVRITTSTDSPNTIASFNGAVRNCYFSNVTQITTTQTGGTHGGTQGITYEYNTFDNLKGSIKVATRYATSGAVIRYNHIRSGPTNAVGIVSESYSDVLIDHNTIENLDGFAMNIYTNTAAPTTWQWGDITITDNVMVNTKYGVRVVSDATYDLEDVTIEHNRFDDVGDPSYSGVIRLNSTIPGGKFDGLSIQHNLFHDIHAAGSWLVVPASAVNVTTFNNSAYGGEGPDPVLHMQLNETSGTAVADDSGFDNDGVISGNPTWTTGHSGNGLAFDGNGDYVSVANDASLNFGASTDFSIAFWAKINPTTEPYTAILSKKLSRAVNRLGYIVKLQNHKLEFQMSDGVDTVSAISASNVDDGQWHHYAITVDRDGVAQIYIDGVANGSSANVSSVGNIDDAAADFVIGSIGYKNSAYFNGVLDDVRIYAVLLTSQDIVDLAT